MLLVDFYNYVYDTVDNTIEEYDESKLEILESLGIVKGTLSICQSETDNSICVKGTEWYNKYANIELSRGRLTGAFKTKGYELGLDMNDRLGVCNLASCNITGVKVNIEIPFYCYLATSFNINSDSKIDLLKIHKRGKLGLPLKYLGNKLLELSHKGRINFSWVDVNKLDLSELSLEDTKFVFKSSNIGTIILNSDIEDFSEMFYSCVIGNIKADLSNGIDFYETFKKTEYFGDIDLSVCHMPNCNTTFLSAVVHGKVTVGQCSNYTRMFYDAQIKKVVFNDCILEGQAFYYSKIITLDLRKSSIKGFVDFSNCSIDNLFLSSKNCKYFLEDSSICNLTTIKNLTIDGVSDNDLDIFFNSKETTMSTIKSINGFSDLKEPIETITFIDCGVQVIKVLASHTFYMSFKDLKSIVIIGSESKKQKEKLKKYMWKNYRSSLRALVEEEADDLLNSNFYYIENEALVYLDKLIQ